MSSRLRKKSALPTLDVFAKGIIEKLAAEDALAQDVERRRRLGVGIRSELHNGLRVGHDRNFVIADNVGDDVLRLTATRQIVFLPKLLGDELEKGVEPPRPSWSIGARRN